MRDIKICRYVLDIIRIVREKYNVDPDRIYLMGHSMGGWGTWWIGLRNPDLFAAICPMAGYAPPDLLPNAEHLSPFIIHSEDDPVVPVSGSRIPAAQLAELGISFRYKEENGYGHASKMIGDNFPELFNWLDSHRRKTNPSSIRFVTRSSSKGNAWWIAVLETVHYPKTAEVEAVLKEPDLLMLRTQNILRLGIDLENIPRDKSKPLRVLLNDQSITISESGGWGIFRLEIKDDKWKWSHQESSELASYKSQVLAVLPKDAPEASSP